MEDHDLDSLRRQLHEERNALDASAEARRTSADTVELDQTRTGRLTRMDALQGQAMARASSARATQRLQAIQRALERIERGDYGECRECGEEIALARLKVDPCALFCIGCAEARQ
ncbi:MAG: TraR/DksA C4-type zinc finger protein [Gammaproteobacteria bacterium]|nr:TraR/DksA C4-type zinc finger protein [Gammaproteobacteria bacterium]